MKRLLLIGGGHAHVEVVRQFGSSPPAGVELLCVSLTDQAPYSGMLPGLIAGHYDFADCHIDVARLCRNAGARFVLDEVVGLDPQARTVRLRGGGTLEYDVASIDTGSTPPVERIAGAREHAIAVKPVETMLAALATLDRDLRAGTVRSIAVVGGGAAGIEVLMALRHRHARLVAERKVDYRIVTDSDDILPTHFPRVRRIFRRLLERQRIAVDCAVRVAAIEPGTLRTQDGACLAADRVIVAVGAKAAEWFAATGLALDQHGFIALEPSLRSTSHPTLFGAGDCATVLSHPRPKSGVFAVRQGPILSANLRRALDGAAPLPFVPQERALALISAGDRYAVATRGDWALEGRWVWRWKDWIDRRFMARYGAGVA